MATDQHSNAPTGRAIPDPVLARIEQLQAIQRKNPPTSETWQRASDELAPLFAQMALRQAVAVLSTAHVEILDNRTRSGREPLDMPLVTIMIAEGFARGAMWGIERTQHAVAITHARYRTELDDDAEPQGGAR